MCEKWKELQQTMQGSNSGSPIPESNAQTHWAIKVPERLSHLHLALQPKQRAFTQVNQVYRCHHCNGPCMNRTLGCPYQSLMPKPLGHKGNWTTQSLTIGLLQGMTNKHAQADIVNDLETKQLTERWCDSRNTSSVGFTNLNQTLRVILH